jgi:hypothetical protein
MIFEIFKISFGASCGSYFPNYKIISGIKRLVGSQKKVMEIGKETLSIHLGPSLIYLF